MSESRTRTRSNCREKILRQEGLVVLDLRHWSLSYTRSFWVHLMQIIFLCLFTSAFFLFKYFLFILVDVIKILYRMKWTCMSYSLSLFSLTFYFASLKRDNLSIRLHWTICEMYIFILPACLFALLFFLSLLSLIYI